MKRKQLFKNKLGDKLKKIKSILMRALVGIENMIFPILTFRVNFLLVIGVGYCIIAAPTYYEKALIDYTNTTVFKMKHSFLPGSGTGFIIRSPKGLSYLATNDHVCEHLAVNGVLVAEANDAMRTRYNVKILARDSKQDVCITTSPTKVRGFLLGKVPKIGQKIQTFGHPAGGPLRHSRGEVIAARLSEVIYGSFPELKTKLVAGFEISAVSAGGSSGSPVLDSHGLVVGIVFAGMPFNPYTTLMVSVKYIEALLLKL